MRSDEVAIGEAVAALTARLTSWHVEEAAEKAHQYVRDMLHQGWRPRGPITSTPSYQSRPAPCPEGWRDTIRAELARARAGNCVHGIPAAICLDPHREYATEATEPAQEEADA